MKLDRSKHCIIPQPLTRDAFAIFGDVIEVDEKRNNFMINDGYTQRYHDLAKVDVSTNAGKVLLNIFRATPLPEPIIVKKMERHPLSSQAFIPLGEQPYLVVVAPAGPFDETAIRVFSASPDQGVNYNPGTWHHFCLAQHEISDFLVVDRSSEGENCDIAKLNRFIEIGHAQ